MKVVCIKLEGCDFCMNFSNAGKSGAAPPKVGRHYTVTFSQKIAAPWGTGVGFLLAEAPIPDGYLWCSCAFREVNGDAEEWQRTLRENRPKTKSKELEPA